MNGKRKGSRKWPRLKKRSGGAHKPLQAMMALVAIIAALFVGLVGAPAQATNGGQVCTGLDSGKIDTTGDPQTVTVTAPEGMLIDGYCVKAGSVNQGDGPVYVTVDPPVKTLTFGYPDGKAVSHYSLSYTTAPPPVDVCPNIEGDQSEVPDGYEIDDAGNCVPVEEPPTDVCPNIPGDQSEVPDGYEIDDAGNCVPVEEPPFVCPDGSVPEDENGNGVGPEDCIIIDDHPVGDVTVTAHCGYIVATNNEDDVMSFTYGSFGSLDGPDVFDDEVTVQSGDSIKIETTRRSVDWMASWEFGGLVTRGINLKVAQDCGPDIINPVDHPTFETGLSGQPQSEGGVPVGLLYALLTGLFGGVVLIASPMLARARQRR